MKLVIVFGTRPEIIKLSALIKLADRSPDVELSIVHTGQHYSYNLSERFLEDLDLPHISEDIAVGSLERLDQIARMVKGLTRRFTESKPDLVMVQGDTNSTLAGAFAARECGVPAAHVEAGLRCFDELMVEEMNRRETDEISDICFAPTPVSVENLLTDGVEPERVHLVGNTIVEVVTENLAIADRRSDILARMELAPESYVLITAHRQENVDEELRLRRLVAAAERIELPMVYPVHPRTMERIVEFELLHVVEAIDNLTLTDPLPYWDFLELSRASRLIITDSGGIQEECTVYQKPIVVVRDCTERPEIIGTFGEMVGSDTEAIVAAVARVDRDYPTLLERLRTLPCPYGDGTASERILAKSLEIYG